MNEFERMLRDIECDHASKAKSLGMTPDQLHEEHRKRWQRWERDQERDRWVHIYRDDVSEKILRQVHSEMTNDTPPLQASKRWLDTDGNCLVLCGTIGTGKSTAAIWLLRKLGGEVVRAGDLAKRVDPWRDDRRAGVRELNLRARFAVLDDLGTEADTARFHEALFRFVDSRLYGVRTVITANMPKSEIRSRYGDRIADRLNDIAMCFEHNGETLRGKRAGL